MFRRSRFSARPNVGATGRTAQEAPSASQDASETPKDVAEGGSAAVTDMSGDTSHDIPFVTDGNGQHGENTGTPAALQRRKRFSIKPKVAPGRPSAVARAQKSPVKAASETPVEVPASGPDKPTTSRQTAAAVAPQRLQSPRRRRSSGESKQPKMQPKQTLVPSDSPEPLAESAENPPADGGRESQSTSDSQVEGVPSKLQDKVPFSILDREAMELSERAKTLVSSKSRRCPSPSAFSLSRLLNDPSDIQRIAKAQKLRDLLKQEMHKDKKRRKTNTRVKEYNLDPAKMTMSELIRYLPESNPMTSPERSQKLEAIPKIGTPRQVEEELDEEEEDEDDSVMVPQVKVAEDGTLIIDEESLTVEVQRAKGPNPANDRDPIFERGSTTTYASFRKGTYTKPWSSEETDMFFLAVSMVGTDFSMICQLFPLRARSEIKNKFKKEERENSWRVDKAFRKYPVGQNVLSSFICLLINEVFLYWELFCRGKAQTGHRVFF
uniref:Zgc:162472 n=1 Tax=Gasterosteus aculeatus aculeatus TaxID=481459 RepID=G3PTI6_GASAC